MRNQPKPFSMTSKKPMPKSPASRRKSASENPPRRLSLHDSNKTLAGAGSRAVCEGLAQPALSPLQILEFTQQKSSKLHLALDSVGQLKIKPPRASQLTPITDQNQQHVFSLISSHATGLSFEELLYESGMGLPALQGALTEMELEGWVARQGALYYPKG